MDRLILLRHGKAEPDSETGEDFDRRLASLGVMESTDMGVRLADMGFRPDVALVSPAARARGTWEAASAAFPGVETRFDDDLYHADSGAIRREAEKALKDHATVMIVGHNPGLQELVVMLLQEGHAPSSLVARAQRNFPTATAAIFLIDDNGLPHFDGLFFPER
ncbi:histidine phosphatase family protein [Phenylobacterium sp.]|uniref:SixA phosphatase family protein n=1 Tax=Phenylobacterium sp. TaxID=1871053 RepID=UPI0025ED8E22|nr:histidine phosphatase family protein [Phenylobacterium sp.]